MVADTAAAAMPSNITGSFTDVQYGHLRTLSGIGSSTSVNGSAILALEQRHTIRIMATATSTFSIAAVLTALYWFFMMRRNFRRDLVLLLIIGDFWKSMVYWLFSIVTFARGPVDTDSHFCQASGFLVSQGLESCDMAILLMSLHMYLQIFPPTQSFLGHDGLYRIRYWVVAAWFLVPTIMASLAFVNPRGGYGTTGAFCTLPIRPYWYRLALSWIPRYLIWFFVMGVAIRIYRHVGQEFRVFGYERDRSSSLEMPGASSAARDAVAASNYMVSQRRKSTMPGDGSSEKHAIDDEIAPDDKSSLGKLSPSQQSPHDSGPSLPASQSRRPSSVKWSVAFDFPVEPHTGPASTQSPQSSRRPSRQIAPGVVAADFAPVQDSNNNRPRGSITTLGSARSATASNPDLLNTLAPIHESENRASTSVEPTPAPDIAGKVMRTRHRAIQRQLRLLFIYPVIYMILWVIPFVNHAMGYSDYYAQYPIYPITALSTFCQCFMGFADVYIFCWREKPWRHIPGSDGTFWGSFFVWRFSLRQEWADRLRRGSKTPSDVPEEGSVAAQSEKAQPNGGVLSSLKRLSGAQKESLPRDSRSSIGASVTSRMHRRAYSGGSDRKQLEVDLAHQRLAMERKDWEQQRKGLGERRDTALSLQQQHNGSLHARASRQAGHEWWDRQVENELFHDDDDDDEAEGGHDGDHSAGAEPGPSCTQTG